MTSDILNDDKNDGFLACVPSVLRAALASDKTAKFLLSTPLLKNELENELFKAKKKGVEIKGKQKINKKNKKKR